MNFQKVLVANRGEIALRIMKTCHRLGFQTVAVYSEADAIAPHVRFADQAVCIGASSAAESYLNMSRVIEAAKQTGAEAIHPGYGFLAENAEFASAVAAAGLTFIGPGVEAIRVMGDKSQARALMQGRGVPVAPGYAGDDQSDAALIAAADDIGVPLLVKAAAGGGGKGMSIVRDLALLPDALVTARRVAESAFGDSTLLLEKYIESPRHIEVQILGDTLGHVVHCFERECSIQRRFQKVIEEAPSEAIDESLRQRFCHAAVTAGEALGYVGAGTVEFIMSPDGEFYFLEVNTRLQVEHPVTEMITGLDLVEWQLRVASGEALPAQETITRTGHAIEARIYAEDPQNEFLPATGQLLAWRFEDEVSVRIDSGVEAGSTIGIDYDPMLAKVITVAPDRHTAIRKLHRALSTSFMAGVQTNRRFLLAVLEDERFIAGNFSTHFLGEHFAQWSDESDDSERHRCAIAAVVWCAENRAAQRQVGRSIRPGWRNNRAVSIRDTWRVADQEYSIAYRRTGSRGYQVEVDGAFSEVVVVHSDAVSVSLEITDATGLTNRYKFALHAGAGSVFVGHNGHVFETSETPRFPRQEQDDSLGGCAAPMPGRVIKVHVEAGMVVEEGQALVVLEAMKMEQVLCAPNAGVVTAVNCAEGEVVDAGTVLVSVESDESTE